MPSFDSTTAEPSYVEFFKKQLDQSLQACADIERLKDFAQWAAEASAVAEFLILVQPTIVELKTRVKHGHHLRRLKIHINFLSSVVKAEFENIQSQLRELGFYINLLIGLSLTQPQIKKLNKVTLTSLKCHSQTLRTCIERDNCYFKQRFIPCFGKEARVLFQDDFQKFTERCFYLSLNEEGKRGGQNRVKRKKAHSDHLPGTQLYPEQVASDHFEREKENIGNEASKRDFHTTAKPLQKKARTAIEVHAESSSAPSTGGCLQEHRSDVQHPTVSFSVTQDAEHLHIDSRIAVPNLIENLKPVQPVTGNDVENNRAQGQTKVPSVENTTGYVQENNLDARYSTLSSNSAREIGKPDLKATCSPIDSRKALFYLLRKSGLVRPSAALTNPGIGQHPCPPLTLFLNPEAVPALKDFPGKVIPEWENVSEIEPLFKDSEASLKLLNESLDTVHQDAVLLEITGQRTANHLIVYQDRATWEALARLPQIPI